MLAKLKYVPFVALNDTWCVSPVVVSGPEPIIFTFI